MFHLTKETSSEPVRFTVPLIVFVAGEDVVIIAQKAVRDNLGIDVVAKLKASVLNACGCQDCAGVELTDCAVGDGIDVVAQLKASVLNACGC